jgi:hypothetical protein
MIHHDQPFSNEAVIWKLLFPKLWFIFLLVHVSCFTSGNGDNGYWTRGCIGPDERTIGATGSEAVLIDLVSGKVTHSIPGFFDDVICLADNNVVALTPREAVWLTTAQRKQRESAWTVVGPLGANEIVVSFRALWKGKTIQSWDGPLNVKLEGLNASTTSVTSALPIRLAPEVFPVLGHEPASFLETIPVRLLDDKRLLIAAGYSSTKFEQERPWSFFTVEMKSGAVAPFGPMRKGDEDLSLFVRSTKFGSTDDGRILAGSSGKTIVVLNSDSADPVIRIPLENVKEIQQLQFNQEGTLLAAGLTAMDGGAGRIEVFDATNGKRLWQTENQKGVIYFLQFVRDGSLVFLRSNRKISRRNGKDGTSIY